MDFDVENTYDVDADIDEVWTFLTDFDAVGGCIPGVEDYTIDGNHIESKIDPPFKFMKGVFSSEADVMIVEEGEKLRIEQTGESIGGSFELEMLLTLKEVSAGTEIEVMIDAHTQGVFKPVPKSVGRGVADRLVRQMFTCMAEHIE